MQQQGKQQRNDLEEQRKLNSALFLLHSHRIFDTITILSSFTRTIGIYRPKTQVYTLHTALPVGHLRLITHPRNSYLRDLRNLRRQV